MSKGVSSPYQPFPCNFLKDNMKTPFDIYCKVKGDFVLYAKKDYLWELAELKRLLSAGIERLFYANTDSEQFKTFYFSQLPKIDIDSNLPPEKRMVTIYQIGADLMQGIFHGTLNQDAISKVKQIVSHIQQCLKEDIKSIQPVQALANHDYYTYFHSVSMASHACAVGTKLGMSDHEIIQLGIGAILHDVGKKEVPTHVLNKPGPLTEEEWAVIKTHPASGIRLLKPLNIDPEALDIVIHHHEKFDASGYPDGLGLHSISDKTQICFLCDVFTALTTNRSYHKQRTRFDALAFIKEKLPGQYNQEVFKILVFLFTQNIQA